MNEDFLNTILQNVVSLPPPKSNDSTENRHSELTDNKKPEFSLNTISQKSINILGFDLFFDDIILLAIILFLLQEENKDYILIIILGMMFLDFTLDKINKILPIQSLLNNFT